MHDQCTFFKWFIFANANIDIQKSKRPWQNVSYNSFWNYAGFSFEIRNVNNSNNKHTIRNTLSSRSLRIYSNQSQNRAVPFHLTKTIEHWTNIVKTWPFRPIKSIGWHNYKNQCNRLTNPHWIQKMWPRIEPKIKHPNRWNVLNRSKNNHRSHLLNAHICIILSVNEASLSHETHETHRPTHKTKQNKKKRNNRNAEKYGCAERRR